ncbi:hypothetical protein GQ42DRAFT_160980, partial [Ramicandelaber brevisporus]
MSTPDDQRDGRNVNKASLFEYLESKQDELQRIARLLGLDDDFQPAALTTDEDSEIESDTNEEDEDEDDNSNIAHIQPTTTTTTQARTSSAIPTASSKEDIWLQDAIGLTNPLFLDSDVKQQPKQQTDSMEDSDDLLNAFNSLSLRQGTCSLCNKTCDSESILCNECMGLPPLDPFDNILTNPAIRDT